MSAMLQSIDGVGCLTDDILIAGHDQQEHDSRLHAVLRRLMDAYKFNSKLEIFVWELNYIGHIVGSDGVKIDH